ncbi:sulfate/molybdate ABC transporter ATP-binding protein [Desulfuribacillus alkaliarsenatis]|uniref:ABC transporter domain-containing protein n=1 Tax=Desulfuribacillus alkaliarsenatis TaxID=766136 RepID=A0A1E5FZC9_9FIRM|nr:sulfate/molybdate ABC transporter ATP-binding protein [Desulfuribacillus alkaliarsenatis]OEF95925.1 hypothetical protein BHF68_11080 [Desulfuribacillus alkaliarsenatis]
MSLSVDIERKLPDFLLRTKFDTENENFGILGASGSGKSMTLRCIAGLDKPTKGRIVLHERVLFDSEQGINIPAKDRKIGYLFQNYALFPHMTVKENIEFGIRQLSSYEREKRIKDKLEMIQLGNLSKRYPYELSGGQQQRVALARAMVTEPVALLLDEPFSALDNFLRRHMERELIEVLESYSGVTLFVTHNLEEAYRVCERLMIMDNGQVIADDHKGVIFRKPPTHTVAKLTGCKNISAIELQQQLENKEQNIEQNIEANYTVAVAMNWGNIQLKIQQLPGSYKYIGIRAFHIKVADDLSGDNCFEAGVIKTEEGPHHMTVYLQIGYGTGKHHLQMEIYKEKWKRWQNKKSLYIQLKPEHLFLTK